MTTPTVDGGDEYLPCTLIYSPDHYSTYIPRCECEDALNVLPMGFDKPEPGLCHTATPPWLYSKPGNSDSIMINRALYHAFLQNTCGNIMHIHLLQNLLLAQKQFRHLES